MKHNIKTSNVQLEELENKEGEKIVSKNKLTYSIPHDDLGELDLVYKSWVMGILDDISPEFPQAARKIALKVSGQQTHTIDWEVARPELDGDSYRDRFGEVGSFEMWQNNGTGNFYKVEFESSVTLDMFDRAEIYTFQLDGYESIIIIS